MNTTTATNTSGTTTGTTTGASTRAATSNSLATSAKFKTFAMTFSTFGPVIYCFSQFFNWPMFTYHPATNRLVWGYEGPRPGEGPNMLWYGWTATTLLVAAVVGLVAMTLPEHITRKLPSALIWLFPILAIPYIVYSLMPWWTH